LTGPRRACYTAGAMDLDFSRLRTRPLSERANKVRLEEFAPLPEGDAAPDPLALLPDILVGRDFPAYVRAVARARRAGRPFVLMIGGHVIKTGMSHLIIDLMRRGIVTHLAANGSVSIHDFEIALIGETSEDVAANLPDGSFGNWEETGAGLNAAVNRGAAEGLGYGSAVGRHIALNAFPHADASVFAAAWQMGIPATVHVALGSDIIHQHPTWDAAAMGQATGRDFHRLAETVADLEGGALMNLGSAVLLPETFLKALTIARNLTGGLPRAFTTGVFDMIAQYRSAVNVARRPTATGGEEARGYVFTGHHEILFPLFYCALRREMA
jgi:hypothetical protein